MQLGQSQSDVFAAIAHPIRRAILDKLREDDATVGMLASGFAVSRPAVSQHLAILYEVGLVNRVTRGRRNFYHLEAERLAEIDAWIRHFRRFWDARLDALESVLANRNETDDET